MEREPGNLSDLPPKRHEDLGDHSLRDHRMKYKKKVKKTFLPSKTVLLGAGLLTAAAGVKICSPYQDELKTQAYYSQLQAAMEEICSNGKALEGSLDGAQKLLKDNPQITAIHSTTVDLTVEEARLHNDFGCRFEDMKIPMSFYDTFVVGHPEGMKAHLEPLNIEVKVGENFNAEKKTCVLPFVDVSQNIVVAAVLPDGEFEPLLSYRQKHGEVGEGFVKDITTLTDIPGMYIRVFPQISFDRESLLYSIKASSVPIICREQFEK